MTISQYQILALSIVLLSFVGGMPILKSGSAMLTEQQRGELKAMGPDVAAMAGPIVLLLAAWYSSRYPWPMAAVALVVGGITIYRFPSKLWRVSWPKSARLR